MLHSVQSCSPISYLDIKKELLRIGNEEKRLHLSRYFKTGKGEYGEGDLFIGVTVPQQREIVKKIGDIPLQEISLLLHDAYHECRLTGLLFLIQYYRKTKENTAKETYFHFYLQHLSCINSWDLVDLSAPDIVGAHLFDKERIILYQLANESHLWKKRIAIVSTHYFIRNQDFSTTFALSDLLLSHSHDLIHKAVGWMLREVGKRNYEVALHYLQEDKKYQCMPRTMLRYAIERFPEDIRQQFLKNLI